MSFKEERIHVLRSSRVYVAGEKSGPTIIALHGYGQLGKYFSEKFQPLVDAGFQVVVPEGLHRFYLEGFQGRVGASWMTKEDRLTDILEQKTYLDQMFEDLDLKPERTTIVAFSQGIATAARWLQSSMIQVRQLILWAGNFPPDLDLAQVESYWSSLDIHYVFGDSDEFFNQTRIEELYSDLESRGLEFTRHSGDFKHELNSDLLLRLANK